MFSERNIRTNICLTLTITDRDGDCQFEKMENKSKRRPNLPNDQIGETAINLHFDCQTKRLEEKCKEDEEVRRKGEKIGLTIK